MDSPVAVDFTVENSAYETIIKSEQDIRTGEPEG